MRKVIPLFLAAGLAGPADAAFYEIDLSAIKPIGQAYSCFYCGGASGDFGGGPGPLFPVMHFNPGDTIDFGGVTMDAHFDARDWGRATWVTDATTGLLRPRDPAPFFWIEGGIGVSFDPAYQPQVFDSGIGTATVALEMIYTIPDWADSIQIGWGYADGVYVPPVPEPATWAMLMLGFVLMAGGARAQMHYKGAG